MVCEVPARCSRCGNELNGNEKCLICGKPVETKKPILEDFCRSIGCGARVLLDDPNHCPHIPQERAEQIARIQCQGCRAWQYDRFLR